MKEEVVWEQLTALKDCSKSVSSGLPCMREGLGATLLKDCSKVSQ